MEHFVCRLSDLEEKKVFFTNIDHFTIGVVKVKGQIYAYENLCPHMEGPVCLGDIRGKVKTRLNEDMQTLGEYESRDEIHIVCPWHGLEFNIEDGVCVPASELRLRKFSTAVRDEGVYITL